MKVRRVQLGDVLTVQRKAASESECLSLPYVGLEHIKKDAGTFEDTFRRKPESLLASKYRFTPQHVLYSKLRPNLNKVALPNFDGVCTTEILPLLPEEGILDKGFLHSLMLSSGFVSWASRSVSGANLPRLDPGLLEEYTFDLPPLAEQRRIAAQLEQADRLRRTRRYTLDLSDTFLPATFRRMFGDAAHEKPRWKSIPISELCEAITDCVNKTAPLAESVTPFKMIRTTNVRNGEVDLESVRYVTSETFQTWTRRSVPEDGDVILTREAPLGEAGILRNPSNVFLGQRLVQYRVNRDKATPEYLLHSLLSPDVQRQLKRLGSGSTVEHVAVPDCETLMVLDAPLSQQQAFASVVREHERLRSVQRESLRQAEHLFQTLLHRAFAA